MHDRRTPALQRAIVMFVQRDKLAAGRTLLACRITQQVHLFLLLPFCSSNTVCLCYFCRPYSWKCQSGTVFEILQFEGAFLQFFCCTFCFFNVSLISLPHKDSTWKIQQVPLAIGTDFRRGTEKLGRNSDKVTTVVSETFVHFLGKLHT